MILKRWRSHNFLYITLDLCYNNCNENSLYIVIYKHTTENYLDNSFLLIKGQAPEDKSWKHEQDTGLTFQGSIPQSPGWNKKAPRVAAKDDRKSGWLFKFLTEHSWDQDFCSPSGAGTAAPSWEMLKGALWPMGAPGGGPRWGWSGPGTGALRFWQKQSMSCMAFQAVRLQELRLDGCNGNF